MTHTRRELTALMERHDLGPSRALGQNFVVDPNTVRRIARLAALGPETPVVEIGAGLGSLTLALAETGAEVVAVETDRHLIPVLHDVVDGVTNVRVVHADAMELDWDDLLAAHPTWVLVANLPYNVATPLVLDLLADVPQIERMLVMVQKEAGERLAAGPGDAAYGIPSVKVAYRATARLVGKVGPDVFVPKPRVDSALVQIVRRDEPATAADPPTLMALIDKSFNQRRKMLRRSLAGICSPEVFAAAGVDPEDRPERLGVQDFGRLAEALHQHRAAEPDPDPDSGTPSSPG